MPSLDADGMTYPVVAAASSFSARSNSLSFCLIFDSRTASFWGNGHVDNSCGQIPRCPYACSYRKPLRAIESTSALHAATSGATGGACMAIWQNLQNAFRLASRLSSGTRLTW